MKAAIAGAGYVGLVSGVCLAAKGHRVACVDINPNVVECLNSGKPHIYERGLDELLAEVRNAGRFQATMELAAAIDGADVLMIAVGTPSRNGVIDLQHIRTIARQAGEYLRDNRRFLSVVVKSTVVPGTTDTVVRQEIEAAGVAFPNFGLGMNPEFLREGDAVADFMEPDRIVLGHEDERTLALLEELYAPWDCEKVRVNSRTAEMIKYANNALLATQISAINEMANIATALGNVDIADVVQGVHLDKRWNPTVNGKRVLPAILTYLVPGCGFGGSCFPKDVQALCSQGKQQGLPMHMLSAVLDVNEAQPRQVTDILQREVGDLEGRRCLVLGLAFKPGTDDVRESVSLKIVTSLINKGAHIIAHDPLAKNNFKVTLGSATDRVVLADNWREHVNAVQVVIIATKWDEYRELPALNLRNKVIFDARRMFAPGNFPGAKYVAIGRRIT